MGNQSSKHHLRSAGDDNGGLKPKKFVHWKSAERPLPPGRPVLIPLSDQQPDVITLKWGRPPSDGGSPIIGYLVEHRRTGSPHWVRATPSLVPRPEASISGLEPGWRYQFRVVAENVVGKSDPSELSDPLTVTLQRSAISVPRFVIELQDTTAVENDRVEMRVSVVGHPTPEINWFKDGFEIFSSRRTKIVNENDSNALIIHQAAFTDEGEIKCTATNRAGHVVTRARLSIEAPPKIRLPRQYEDGLIFEAEEIVRLKVGIAGLPVPTVMWSHEGVPIKNDGRFELVTTDKNSSLKITNIKRSDRGEYTLRASNKLGEDIASFLVTVTSRPNPPGKVKLQMSFGRSATLTWEAPMDDGGCKIGNYIIEYFRVGWNVWLKASTTRKQTVTLHDLIEGSEYNFRVKAENPYGLSEPSEQSDTLFIPDPSRGIIKPQQDEVLMPNGKPIPPKRKNLSPLRNLLSGNKKIAGTTSPNRQPSPARKANLISEAYDSEDIKREMSYGTPNDSFLNKDNKRPNVSKKVDTGTDSMPSSTPQLKRSVDERKSTPSPSNPATLKPEGINQKLQNFLRLSPRSARKKQDPPTPEKTSSEYSPASSIKSQQIISFSEKRSEASAFDPSRGNESAPLHSKSVSSPLKRSQEETRIDQLILENDMETIESKYQRLGEELSQGEWMREHRRSLILTEEETIDVNALKVPRLSLPNPRIEISHPNPDFNTAQSPGNVSEIYTSSEYMLVLYPNRTSQERSKEDSFELDLAESLMHPQLSISSPDLSSDMQYLQELQLRRSASSTELLYERAMARFYEAVELEEAEKSKRRQISQDTKQSMQVNSTVRKRLGSMTEAERLSFERRSNMRRRVSGDFTQPLAANIPSKWDSKDCLNLMGDVIQEKHFSSLETQDSTDMPEDDDRDEASSESDYDEDYTESTASSDSIEKFKIEMMTRTQPVSLELETYHPREMGTETGTFSPYRSPEPDQSSVVLVKPLPLPNPDFVPKPILKRSSIDNNISSDKEESTDILNVEPLKTTESTSPKPESKSKGFKAFFRRDKGSNSGKNSLASSPKERSPKELSPKQAVMRETSSKEPSPNQLSPLLSPPLSLSQEPSPRNSLSPKELSPFRSFTGRFSPKQQSPKIMSPKELSPQSSDKKLTTQAKIEAFVQKQDEINERINRQREELMRRKLESSKSAEEETKVAVDYYSHIVNEMGSSRKDKVPLYLSGDDLIRAARTAEEEEEKARRQSLEAKPDELNPQTLSKPRMSIVERMQTAHVQEKSKHAMDQAKSITGESQDKEKPPIESTQPVTEEQPKMRGRPGPSPRKFKRRTTSGSRTRDTSAMKINEKASVNTEVFTPVGNRNTSRSRTRTASKSPGALNRRPVKRDPTPDIRLPVFNIPPQIEGRPQTPEEMSEEAQEKIRSTVSYATDVGLFVVACWVYLFKDARLVIPILALMVYRQISEIIRDRIPKWMSQKKS